MPKIRVYLVCDWDEQLRPFKYAFPADDENRILSDCGISLERTGKQFEIFREDPPIGNGTRIFFHVPETGLISPGNYTRMVSSKKPYRQQENVLPAPSTQRILQANLIPQDIIAAALFERSVDMVIADELRRQTFRRFEDERNEIDTERIREPYSQELRIEAQKRKDGLDRQLDEELKQLCVPDVLHYVRKILMS